MGLVSIGNYSVDSSKAQVIRSKRETRIFQERAAARQQQQYSRSRSPSGAAAASSSPMMIGSQPTTVTAAVKQRDKPTEKYIPLWLLNELDLGVILLHPLSADFSTACGVLRVVMETYMNDRGELQRELMGLAKLTIERMKQTGQPKYKSYISEQVYPESLKAAMNVAEQVIIQQQRINEERKKLGMVLTTSKTDNSQEAKAIAMAEGWIQELQQKKTEWNEGAMLREKEESEMSLLEVVDQYTLESILMHLKPADLAAMSQTCGKMANLLHSELFWQSYVMSNWPASAVVLADQHWKDVAIAMATKSKKAKWYTGCTSGSGLFTCSACGEYWWAQTNHPSACKRRVQKEVRHISIRQEPCPVIQLKSSSHIIGHSLTTPLDTKTLLHSILTHCKTM